MPAFGLYHLLEALLERIPESRGVESRVEEVELMLSLLMRAEKSVGDFCSIASEVDS
jgi:hypothetical protein